MAGLTSLEAVKRKIKSLQDQADGAEERAERLQKDLGLERKARETVSLTWFIWYKVASPTLLSAAYIFSFFNIVIHAIAQGVWCQSTLFVVTV